MNLAVAFTEYQLLQVQALANHYKLNDLYLIILDNDRIQPWLIQDDLFADILILPGIESKRWKRLLKSHIEGYKNILEDFFKDKKTNIFIGAQDENTLFNVIRKLATPLNYWNIEDGFANYYNRNWKFRTSIWIKRKLFKYLYGYDLSIAYAHGQVTCDRSFRMAPLISTGEKDPVQLAPILRKYLSDKSKYLFKPAHYPEDLNNLKHLIVTDISHFDQSKVDTNSFTVYKFHPKDKVSDDIGIRYLKEKIPLEVLPFICPDLNTIRFEVMSSSILNILCMEININIEIAFKPEPKPVKDLISYVNERFNDKVELVN